MFKRGYFNSFSNRVSFFDQKAILDEMYHSDRQKVTIFISHKHSDLDELKGIIGFFQSKYDIECYIDSEDSKMPKRTNEKTALRIKSKIRNSDKFILLATNDAIESFWCNWELGYGDAFKYKKNIAIFPMCDKNDDDYIGNEYLQIYPYIVERKLGDTYTNGKAINPGYYIRYKKEDSFYLKEFSEWLKGGL